MRKFLFILLMFLPGLSFAAQWIELGVSDIDNIQLVQQNNSHGSQEGLYIALKSDITGEAGTYCPRKDFLVITDSKLIDRVYAGLMYAATTQKTVRFYINGAGSCVMNGPLVAMFTLKL